MCVFIMQIHVNDICLHCKHISVCMCVCLCVRTFPSLSTWCGGELINSHDKERGSVT